MGVKWDTPSGESIAAVSAMLSADTTPGSKYIVILTDGNPDTCATRDPQCGQDASIAATQAAFAKGIRLIPIGVGELLAPGSPSGCTGRCGEQHLQDLANAGSGQPVAANDASYPFSQCVGGPANLKGVYAASGAAGGSAPYYAAQTGDQLKAAFTNIFNAIATCH